MSLPVFRKRKRFAPGDSELPRKITVVMCRLPTPTDSMSGDEVLVIFLSALAFTLLPDAA